MKKLHHSVIFLWTGLAALTGTTAQEVLIESSAAAENRKWEAAVREKLTDFSPEPGSIICIGSSQMERWKTIANDLTPLTVHNLAIGGSQMKQAADVFVASLVVPFKPRAVILYEGSNDIASGVSPERFLERFRAVHRQIHAALPKTRLYVLGIVPSPGDRFKKWETIQRANELLKLECATEPWMRFIDTTTPLIGADGQPRDECFIPGDVHMTSEGYKAWTSVIAPVVVAAEKQFEPNHQP